MRSKPALQNAEMEWKNEYQIPFPTPNSLMNAGASRAAPVTSIMAEVLRIKPVSFTMPPIW